MVIEYLKEKTWFALTFGVMVTVWNIFPFSTFGVMLFQV
jgi:hypothetical protein